jgi:choline dehydrogenase
MTYYDVPILKARACEDEHMRWGFFARHYSTDNQQQRNSKYVVSKSGVLYPQEALWETTQR